MRSEARPNRRLQMNEGWCEAGSGRATTMLRSGAIALTLKSPQHFPVWP